jgi:ketosteroid isomerase-like protein
VADGIDWLPEQKGLHRGHIRGTGTVLPNSAQLHTEHLIVKDDQAVVELHSLATAKNGMRFEHRDRWVVCFENGMVVRVRAYLDSALVARLFHEHPIS